MTGSHKHKNVLQIVEYEADQGGYRPQIRYEGEANTGRGGGRGGFGSRGGGPSGSGSNGYSDGGTQGDRGGQGSDGGYNYDGQSTDGNTSGIVNKILYIF